MSSTSTNTNALDEQLAEQISARDHSAAEWETAQRVFEELYQRHARRLTAFLATRVRRSDLDDVHQAVWQRVWQHLPTQFRGGNFRAWLYQIARNHLIDRSRKKTADPLEDESWFPDDGAEQPDAALLEEERMQALASCLKRLEVAMADLVQARLSGEAYDVICARLDISPARAHKLFHTAKEQLSTCVQRKIEP